MANLQNTDEGYGTHLDLLRKTVELTTGVIVECGTGKHSTPFLSEVSKSQNRTVVSLDNDKEWFEKNKAKYATDLHQFFLVDDWNITMWSFLRHVTRPSVCLVDQHPSAARLVSISAMGAHAEFIVVHDTEQPMYYYQPLLHAFRFRYDDTTNEPHTTVVSNYRDFAKEMNL